MRGEESDGRGRRREGGGPIKPDGCFVPDCRLAGWLDRGTMMHITPSIRASERHSAAFPPEARWSGGLGTLDHLDVHDDGRLGRNGSNLLSFPQNFPCPPFIDFDGLLHLYLRSTPYYVAHCSGAIFSDFLSVIAHCTAAIVARHHSCPVG